MECKLLSILCAEYFWTEEYPSAVLSSNVLHLPEDSGGKVRGLFLLNGQSDCGFQFDNDWGPDYLMILYRHIKFTVQTYEVIPSSVQNSHYSPIE